MVHAPPRSTTTCAIVTSYSYANDWSFAQHDSGGLSDRDRLTRSDGDGSQLASEQGLERGDHLVHLDVGLVR